MTKPIKQQPYEKRIHAKFYATESGNEPVKESLLELGQAHGYEKRIQNAVFRLWLFNDIGSFLSEENPEDSKVRFGFGLGSNEEMGSHTKRF